MPYNENICRFVMRLLIESSTVTLNEVNR